MSVKLRLTRMGNKKRSFFRIVATNTASRRDGRPLEFLGYYNPQVSPADIQDRHRQGAEVDGPRRRDERHRALAHEAVCQEGRRLVRLRLSSFSATRSASAGRLGSFVFFYVAVKRTVSALLFSTPAFADGWRGSASKIPAARLENTCFPESLCS